jgi:hypothetical protein
VGLRAPAAASSNGVSAGLTEGYWDLVVDKIFTLKPLGTPVAVTPPRSSGASHSSLLRLTAFGAG